jgi:hypothetical protein
LVEQVSLDDFNLHLFIIAQPTTARSTVTTPCRTCSQRLRAYEYSCNSYIDGAKVNVLE